MPKKTKNSTNNKKQKQTPTKQQQKVVYVPSPQMGIGAQLGNMAGNMLYNGFKASPFSYLLGKGDYTISENINKISKNSMLGSSMKPPSFASGGKGQFVFEHNEYAFDVISSSTPGAFKSNTYTINPSIPDLFPWLSSMASNFEYYQIEGLMFRYVSTSGDSVASTNTALGTVMMYVNPDIYDPLTVSKQALLQYEGCVDAKPTQNILIGAECDPKRMVAPKFYVGTAPVGADRRFNDFGQLIVATTGIPGASVVLGELWAHYKVRFFTAKVPDNDVGGKVIGAHYTRVGAANATPLGVALISKSTLPNFAVTSSSISFDTDDQQPYIFNLVWNGGSVTSVAPSITFTGGTLVSYYNNGTNTDAPNWGSTSTRAITTFVAKADSTGTIVCNLSAGGTIPSSSIVDITVSRTSLALL